MSLNWSFAPEDIVMGRASYTLAQYVDDVRADVQALVRGNDDYDAPDEAAVDEIVRFVLRVCDLAALDYSAVRIAQTYGGGEAGVLAGEDVEQVEAVLEEHAEKVKMLKGIYSRMFIDEMARMGNKDRAWQTMLEIRNRVMQAV